MIPKTETYWQAAIDALALDAIAAEVCGALMRRGILVAVLKGPILVQLLYDDDARRSYRDIDLLVPHSSEDEVYSVLTELGFVAAAGTGTVDPGVAEQHQWSRAGLIVEVHVSLIGVEVDPDDVWSILVEHMTSRRVGGCNVLAFDEVGLALHVALHAAQHGRSWSKAIEDLERALERWPSAVWLQAAQLAVELEASRAFLAGLRLHPKGTILSETVGVTARPDVTIALRAASAPDLAFGLDRLARRSGSLDKARYVARVLAPSPGFMRWWSPLARAGRVGLAVSYVYRPVWLIARLPAACHAYLRARRGASSP